MGHKHFMDTKAATAIEYGLMVASISVALISGLSNTGLQLKTTFCTVSSAITTTITSCGGDTSSQNTSASTATHINEASTFYSAIQANGVFASNLKLFTPVIPKSYTGGTGTSGNNYMTPAQANSTSSVAYNSLQALLISNRHTTITSVFGIYDDKGNPMENISDIQNFMNGDTSKTSGITLNSQTDNYSNIGFVTSTNQSYMTSNDSNTPVVYHIDIGRKGTATDSANFVGGSYK